MDVIEKNKKIVKNWKNVANACELLDATHVDARTTRRNKGRGRRVTVWTYRPKDRTE